MCIPERKKKKNQTSQPNQNQNKTKNQTQTTNKEQPLVWDFQSELFGLPALLLLSDKAAHHLYSDTPVLYPGFFTGVDTFFHLKNVSTDTTLYPWSVCTTDMNVAGHYMYKEGAPLAAAFLLFTEWSSYTYMKNHTSMNSTSGFRS